GVHGNGGLARLTVADDELALAAADRNHRVDGLVAGLHRLAHRLAVDDARRDALDGRGLRGLERTLAIGRLAERVDDATQQFAAHRHFEDAAGGLHRVAFADALVVTQHHGAHRVLLEVERQAEHVARELDHFAVANVRQAMDAADAVRHRDHGTDVARLGGGLEVLDARLDEVADFGCFYGHVEYLFKRSVRWPGDPGGP